MSGSAAEADRRGHRPGSGVSPGRGGRADPDQAESQAARQFTEQQRRSLAEIPHPALSPGTSLYGSTKIFPDFQAREGEVYLSLIHGIAHESSVSFVALLQATRALRKGFETVVYFHGPGAMNTMATRGFPHTGDSAFPGQHNINNQIETFISEGGTVYVCRRGLSQHGLREDDVIAGVIPTHPQDLQDCVIHYSRLGAVVNSTFMI
ncbi:MSMEG_0572/Sll0783 family nitrogen starvation response protein [Frankia sp. R82]|uniref:MSMEG_0572/Sll0783 family nitrogen starvation response protein n=1 Tax=Frankia sp. R82 TaxID=2950553 RepID=UPI002042E8A6|nr:MSMEG_0572/Sll0783 family nitrogen starvation response protein [Frankia sp. R82]MCM3882465.1 MSMEG_0572 family nitrogen starvation response protein [Frankia sp. R82]